MFCSGLFGMAGHIRCQQQSWSLVAPTPSPELFGGLLDTKVPSLVPHSQAEQGSTLWNPRWSMTRRRRLAWPVLFLTLGSGSLTTPTPSPASLSPITHQRSTSPASFFAASLSSLVEPCLFPLASPSQIRHFEEQPWGQLRNSPVFAMACQLLCPHLRHML